MTQPQIELDVARDEALWSLYATEYQRLVGLARLLVDRREDAEEVVQEAFARTWSNLGRVKGDLLPYVRRAVVNQSRGRLRRRRTADTHRPEGGPDAESAESGAIRGEQARHVVERLRQLPRRQRECVVLRFFDDLTVPEIATVLGVADGSVKSHLHRAMTTLAIELEDQR
ncbi:MAG TPA: sigma-70 family RNA polymerase sigma factor [Acidimicrobiales bacterium]|nr:sigma-70 family RNA polymerase sigma factor [Acidimicrobiales bacterium]